VITARDLTAALRAVGVAPSDTLFVHSDVSRCLRFAGHGREEKLDTIIHGLADAVADGVLIMPTFSYSYCRREIFDVERTPSTVGILSERFRTRPGVRRTPDPIFSTAILGRIPAEWQKALFRVADTDCFGEQSVFAYLMAVNAQHLCLGRLACTLIHHIEQHRGVEYRYFKDFRGVIAHDGVLTLTTARYLVRPLENDYDASVAPLFAAMERRGKLLSATLERGPTLSAARARDLAAVAEEEMELDPWFLTQRGHGPSVPSGSR